MDVNEFPLLVASIGERRPQRRLQLAVHRHDPGPFTLAREHPERRTLGIEREIDNLEHQSLGDAQSGPHCSSISNLALRLSVVLMIDWTSWTSRYSGSFLVFDELSDLLG